MGNVLLVVALLSTLASIAAYASKLVGSGEKPGRTGLAVGDAKSSYATPKAARVALWAGFASLWAAGALLLHFFLTHRFDIAYVHNYSDSTLPLHYLISAFWAGQEGTFLLWAMLGSVLALILAYTSDSDEPYTLIFFQLVQVFLIVALLKKSPFEPLGYTPPDGAGLNPLLKDPWMVIHPPIVFVGYAALAVPFAMALGALLRNEYDTWIIKALPWTLFAWLNLGAGIFIGGYWAYTVLGWGGYWAWDPVENSSLIPWLVGTALIHTLLTQRLRGSLRYINLILAQVVFILVVYGTFLTRSGVLADFSVHSFAESGINGIMLFFLALFVLVSVVLTAARFGAVNSDEEYREPFTALVSRDFGMFFTFLLLIASAGLVLFGTSAPVFTGLAGTGAAVDASFYNLTNAPIAVILAITMGICPILAWKAGVSRRAAAGIAVGAIAAVTITAMLAVAARAGLAVMVMVAASVFALGVNVLYVVKSASKGLRRIGGYLTHAGVALMLIGIVASSAMSDTQKISLDQGEPKTVFGYTFVYIGTVESEGKDATELQIEMYKAPAGQAAQNVSGEAASGEKVALASPVIERTKRGLLRHPFVYKTLTGDIYVAPLEVRGALPPGHPVPVSGSEGIVATLAKGEKAVMGGYEVTFLSFAFPPTDPADMKVAAVLEVRRQGNESPSTVMPAMIVRGDGHRDFEAAGMPGSAEGSGAKIWLAALDAGAGTVTLKLDLPAGQATQAAAAQDAQPGEDTTAAQGEAAQDTAADKAVSATASSGTAVIEVTTKPLINVLWLGTILVLLGTAIAIVRRITDTRSKETVISR